MLYYDQNYNNTSNIVLKNSLDTIKLLQIFWEQNGQIQNVP